MKTTKILSLIAFIFCFTLNLRAQSGTCGANLTWELTDSTLTISGSGAMDNSYPWSSYRDQIARVSLPEGLTNICDYAFDHCSNLQSIIIPNTVTSIGYSAFYACTSLKQVTLGNAVETIGSYAFLSTSITSITLPSSVTSIEDYAFSQCKKLTEITIPCSVSSIGNDAFQFCEQLSKVTIEEGVKSIGNSAFQYCSKMTDISLPSSLISIGSSAFSSCSALASVVIPEQITTIEASTFSGCSSLKEVTLPDNLQTIGDNAFYSCSFTHIDIPHSVASLGYSAFSGCDNLTSVTLPNSITNIPRNAFSGCSNLTSVTIPEGVITIGHSAFSYCNLLNLSLPNSLQTIENGAEYFDNGAFEGNKNLTEVTIPDNVTSLGAYTFEGCTTLSRVTLPDGLLSIGACTFQNCTSLRTISFGADLLTIGENAFENCSALSSVAIPDKVSIIPMYAFYNCSVLSQVSLPKQLATIEVAAFMNCKSLSSIILPEGLTTIEGAAFYDCNLTNLLLPQSLRTIGEGVVTVGATTSNYHGAFEKNSNLTTITIPQSVTTLGSDAFAECAALSQVTLSEGLTTIGARAFYNCSALKTIQLPKSITSLVSAFSHCGLEEIEIPENVLILDGTFYECNKLTKVILPSSLTTIDENSFYNCTSLTSITLPQTVRFIGSSAFYGCKSLSQINLPQEITTIESSAFARCSALREMTIPNKITKIASHTFSDCRSLISISLPRNISTIEGYAFEYCTSLTELVLPDSLKSIGDHYCFRGCSALRSLIIPSSVTTLGTSLFDGCISLSSVTMLSPTPPTIDRTFDGAPSTLKINLLCGSKEAYMADANWAALTYPINEISSNILTVKSNDNRMGEAYIPTPNTCDNNTAIIEALPREGYQFAAWHDGNTDNPRTITVTQDTTFTANFEPLTTYQLTVNYDPKQGHISGTGEYYPNEEATLTVTPLGGYRFKKWGDGNTDNPRTIIMTQDTTLEALFITGDYCGDDILYTFLNDTLALNGTGDMWNLSQYGWNMYADEVSALTLSNGITSIGTNAFMNLMFLPEVTIPASVKTIHKRAFENCRSLSSVTFAENSQLQTIDHWAFYECINLKALEIPEGVTTIGNGAFYGCAYLDSIVLPASMMSIADNGFAQCTKLSAMTVNAVTPPAVDSKTFESVNRAIPVYVPFGTGATYRATPIWQEFDIREMEAESNDNKIFYTSSDGNIITPKTQISSFSTFGASIISNVYENGIGTITFDGSVTSIGQGAFEGCSSLTSITIPNGVITIGDDAFSGCSALYSVTLGNSITTIGNNAFYGCASLSSIVIPSSITDIPNMAFYGCSSLMSIVVEPDNKHYDSRNNCNAIIHTSSNTLIKGCSNTTIPNTVTAIAIYAFHRCSFTTISIPNSVWIIGYEVFKDCSSLTSITIPNSVTMMGSGVFSGCSSLSSIIMSNGITAIEPATFSGCSSLMSFTIPSNVTTIGESAFGGCSSLSTITIPEGVNTIGDEAFGWCTSLKSISLSSSVKSIGRNTFYYCDQLNTIYCYATTPPTLYDENTFFNYYQTTLYVPCESSWDYLTHNIWGAFNIQCIEEIPPCEDVTTEMEVTACESYEWNGETYTQSGDYTRFFTTTNGCDSIVTLHLTINRTEVVEFTDTACDSYVWNGITYTESGDYIYETECRKEILHLTINRTEVVEFADTACDSYVWNGITYTESGDYIYETECRKEILHLTINRTEVVEFTETACDSYVWNGITYTESGDYTYSTTTAAGCEHVEVLHLTINESKTTTFETEVTICEGESYTWTVNGITYENLTAGVYSYADTTMYDCSMEINTLLLTIEDCAPPCEDVATEEYATICYGETFTWNGQSYSTTGEYTQTLSTTAGCDSIVTLYLTILTETVIVEESVTINEEYLPYTWRNQQCYSAGTYNESIPFANYPYCDSVIYMLNLTVEAPNKCGDHLYWHYSNNTMTITGYGAMYDDPDLLSYRTQDWYPARVNDIVLPDAITHIGNVAFADCANLTSIVIPSSVTSIGDGAFSWTGLQSITIPASVTDLGEQVFEACNGLHTVLYESEPRSINNQTIHPLIGCVHLDTVIAPAALWHCTTADPALEARYGVPHKARYIEVTDGELTNQAIKYIANNSGAMEILDLTNATNTSLPYGAWSNSYQLSTLYLPQQLEVIPESMVEGGRNLSEIAIPATVTEIGNYAFAGCVNVWRIIVDAVIPPKVYENTFDGISRSISVQVPAGSEELYREAAYWREFFIEHTNNPSPISNCQKLLRKDQILILRNGKVYTAMGQLITNE